MKNIIKQSVISISILWSVLVAAPLMGWSPFSSSDWGKFGSDVRGGFNELGEAYKTQIGEPIKSEAERFGKAIQNPEEGSPYRIAEKKTKDWWFGRTS